MWEGGERLPIAGRRRAGSQPPGQPNYRVGRPYAAGLCVVDLVGEGLNVQTPNGSSSPATP